jgi:hypothetical protein
MIDWRDLANNAFYGSWPPKPLDTGNSDAVTELELNAEVNGWSFNNESEPASDPESEATQRFSELDLLRWEFRRLREELRQVRAEQGQQLSLHLQRTEWLRGRMATEVICFIVIIVLVSVNIMLSILYL